MNSKILDPLIGMYASLKRRFEIKGYLGEMFRHEWHHAGLSALRAAAERYDLSPFESDGGKGSFNHRPVVRG